jgi:hypothetical protein
MLSTFIAGVITLIFPPFALPAAFIAHLCLSYIVLMATWFAALPFSSLSISYFPLSFFFILYGIIIGSVWWWRKDKKEPDPLVGWVIEEEKEKIGEAHSTPSTQSTPIFFR